MPETLKTRKQMLAVWDSVGRSYLSWLEFLQSIPPNTVMTDKEWSAARMDFWAKRTPPKPHV